MMSSTESIELPDKGQSSKTLQQSCDRDAGNENGCCGGGGGGLERRVVEVVDLEAGVVVGVNLDDDDDNKKGLDRDGGICRICHFDFDSTTIQELGGPMELGCSCKSDLATAHKHCAEAWFIIRGNKTCEICGSTASNVTCVYAVNSEQLPPPQEFAVVSTRMSHFHTTTAVLHPTMSSNFWEDHRLLNILLAVMVLAFVISWIFHIKAPKLS